MLFLVSCNKEDYNKNDSNSTIISSTNGDYENNIKDLNFNDADADANKPLDELNELTYDVAKSAHLYVSKYEQTTSFITRGAYLYDLSADKNTSLDDLIDLAGLDNKYKDEKVLILYIKSNDLLNVDTDENLHIYAAHRYKDAYLLADKDKNYYEVSKDDFDTMMNKYRFMHGDIVKVTKKDSEYDKIFRILKQNDDKVFDYDIRSMHRDNRYAVAVISPKNDTSKIFQHILLNDDGKWEILLKNFEKFNRYKVDINRNIVNINMDLLPSYDLFNYESFIKLEFDSIVDVMIENNIISKENKEISFSSGTSDYVYLEFVNGEKFVGAISEQNIWVMYPVQNDEEARIILLSINKNSPLFIIRQLD